MLSLRYINHTFEKFMYQRPHTLIVFLVLMFASSVGFASASEESINKLLKYSGLTAQIQQYPDQIKAGFMQAQQQGTPISTEELNALITSVDEHILPSEIIGEIRLELQKKLSEEEAQHLLKWFKSPIGKEITKAEEAASDPDVQAQIMQQSATLMNDKERVELAKSLDNLVGATDTTMGIYEYSSIAVFSALMTAMQPNTPLNVAPLRAQMSANAAQTRAEIENLIMLTYTFTYKDISITNLKKYEAFLSEPTATKLSRTLSFSMKQAMENSISNWAASLAQLFKQKSK